MRSFFLSGRCFVIHLTMLLHSAGAQTPQVSFEPQPTGTVNAIEEHVSTGVIATQGHFGQFAHINVDTGGGSPGDAKSVLSGSIDRESEDICVAKIVNNGQKPYTVHFSVEGFDEAGERIFVRTRRAQLKSGEAVAKKVFDCVATGNLSLNLLSAKVTKKRK